MKSIPKILFGLFGMGLFALLSNVALAEDYNPQMHRTASDEDSRRDEIRHKKREASLRDMAGLRQRRDAQAQAQPSPSQPRSAEPRQPSPKPDRPSKPPRGKRN